MVDLLKLARQRYPAYVRVEPIGFGEKGAVFWTASQPNAALPSGTRLTDGSLQHVFVWRDGKTRDIGSLGRSDNRLMTVNRHGQIAVSRFAEGPHSIPIPLQKPVPTPPPTHAFLWQRGKFTNLGTLGGRQTWAVALNDRGEIVGFSETGHSVRGRRVGHAFLWRQGKMTDLGTLGGQWSDPTAINDRGQVVGSSQTRSGVIHAFLWENGRMTDLGTLGGRYSEATGINERGQVIGASARPWSPKLIKEAFLWQAGKITSLGVAVEPNQMTLRTNDDVVIGVRNPYVDPRGFVWHHGTLTSLGTSTPTGIDLHGDVVGGTATKTFRAHAFLWHDSVTVTLPGPALPSSPHVRISPDGTRIVGESYSTAGLRRRLLLWIRAS